VQNYGWMILEHHLSKLNIIKVILVMVVLLLPELELSSLHERMVGLMFGITIIDKTKLHSHIKFQLLLLPRSRSTIQEVEIRLQEAKLLQSEIKTELLLFWSSANLYILYRKMKEILWPIFSIEKW
jgi:hypothetical protein